MADEKQLIDIEALSHFKAKQDVENAKKFKSKDESTDLVGAVRYDTAQVLTPEQKAQARANIGAGTGDGTGSGGVSDYNELLNRPVYGEAFHSFFDGNETPNPPSVEFLGDTWHKVSDLTPTKEQLFEAELYFNGERAEELTDLNIVTMGEKYIVVGLNSNSQGYFDRMIAVVSTTETIEGTFQGTPFTLTVPSVGIYWWLNNGVANSTFEIEYGDIKRLDDVYIPKNIPRLNENGLISAKNLPSYVDDVVEGYYNDPGGDFYGEHDGTFWRDEITGESGKIYLDLLTNNTYRWSGSQFVRINPDEYTVATNADIDALFT